MGKDAVLFEHPIYLFLLAPDDVPVIVPCLLPLTVEETVVNAVLEGGLELYAAADYHRPYGGVG